MAHNDFNIDTTIQDVMQRFGASAAGKTYVITGASTQSLGARAALGLATGSPKQLILIGRKKSKIQPAIDEIKGLNPNVEATFVSMDLLDLSSVRRSAEDIIAMTSEIHGLINCAGIMAVQNYQESKDGIESQFAVNHISHFLLTNLLKEQLGRGNGVVVNVSSGGYELADIDYEDVNFDGGKTYNSWVAYARSKTANILFSVALAEKGRKDRITAFAVNPGLVAETSLQSNSSVSQEHFMEGVKLYKERHEGRDPPVPTAVSTAQGAATIVLPLLDSGPQSTSGTALHECQGWPVRDYAKNPAKAAELWKLSEKLVGQEFEW